MIRTVLLLYSHEEYSDFRASGLGAEKMEKENKKLQVIHRHKKNLIALNARGNVMRQIEKHGSEKLVTTTNLIVIEFVSIPRKNR